MLTPPPLGHTQRRRTTRTSLFSRTSRVDSLLSAHSCQHGSTPLAALRVSAAFRARARRVAPLWTMGDYGRDPPPTPPRDTPDAMARSSRHDTAFVVGHRPAGAYPSAPTSHELTARTSSQLARAPTSHELRPRTSSQLARDACARSPLAPPSRARPPTSPTRPRTLS